MLFDSTGSTNKRCKSGFNSPINISGLEVLSGTLPDKTAASRSPVTKRLFGDGPTNQSQCIPSPPPGFPFLNCGGSYISYGYVVTAPYPSKRRGSSQPTAHSSPTRPSMSPQIASSPQAQSSFHPSSTGSRSPSPRKRPGLGSITGSFGEVDEEYSPKTTSLPAKAQRCPYRCTRQTTSMLNPQSLAKREMDLSNPFTRSAIGGGYKAPEWAPR